MEGGILASNILGLSFGYHDSGVAVLRDGEPIAFANEERFSFRKNDLKFPNSAVEGLFRYCGLTAADIDTVVYYEDPALKADRVVAMARRHQTDPEAYLRSVCENWRQRQCLLPLYSISTNLGIPEEQVHCVKHHESHAALAYFMSPFTNALVVTLDGIGEYETLTAWIGEDRALRQIRTMEIPNSVGLLYSAITNFCGFDINEGEYKLMGLAAFGSPTRCDEIREWIRLDPDDAHCRTDMIQWNSPTDTPFSQAFIDCFGAPFEKGRDDHLDPRFADLAASVQRVLEEEVERLITGLMSQTGLKNVCLGGGVALNCNVNGRLRRGQCTNLFVPTAPSDAGSALGAALAWDNKRPRNGDSRSLKGHCPANPYLGTELDSDFLQVVDTVYRPLLIRRKIDTHNPARRIAEWLAEGKVLGHMSGRFEMGPRALGNRSILADPRSLAMQDRVNRLIKHREPFRPFAPMVREEDAHDYFDFPPAGALGDKAPERYMLATHPSKPLARDLAPAAIHVDGTARIQVVSAKSNPRLHGILSEFRDLTGVPILLNTSLNVAGQPMASDIWSGLKTLLSSELDGLVVGDQLVTRR